MYTWKQFKDKFGIEELGMYKSTKSDRHIVSLQDLTVITTEDFDPDKEKFVYIVDKLDEETGELVLLHVISNKKPREADLVLK